MQDSRSSSASSSTPPERPWRVVLMDATLGLELAAMLLALASSALRPNPGFDFLFWTLASLAVSVGVAWRWRTLPMAARAATATIPLLPVVYILCVRSGFLPNVFLALGMIAAMLALWYGPWLSVAFNVGVAVSFLAAGYQVASHGTSIETSMTDPHDFGNWVRAMLMFFSVSTLLAITMHWVVKRVELHARERNEAYHLVRRLYVRLEGAKEEERRHLARELHDELGQVLTALRIRLQVALAAPRETNGPALRDAVSLVDQLLVQVRRLSVDLSPPLLAEAGLGGAIQALVESHPGLTDIDVSVAVDCPERLPEALEVAAFRIVQEALTNVVRHAGATHVRIAVRHDGDELRVSVRDDGRGFDVDRVLQAAAHGRHFGFVGMRERVRGLGGRFTVESHAGGGGTLVGVRLPVAVPG